MANIPGLGRTQPPVDGPDPTGTPEQTEQAPTGPAPGELSTTELVQSTPDDRDVTERASEPDTTGKRVRAIPTHGGTTVKVSSTDFRNNGVEHEDVVFDFRKDDFTLPVGEEVGQISKKAADVITKLEPGRFEYMS